MMLGRDGWISVNSRHHVLAHSPCHRTYALSQETARYALLSCLALFCALLPCPALSYLVLYFLFVILSPYYSFFILPISLPFFIPFLSLFPFLHDTVTLPNDFILLAVTTMGSKEISKWPVVSGNNETWLEFSYYSFEKGTLPYVCIAMYSMVQHSIVQYCTTYHAYISISLTLPMYIRVNRCKCRVPWHGVQMFRPR